MTLRQVVLLSFILWVGAGGQALADTPPPDGYQEKCKVELKEQDGTSCEECANGPGMGGAGGGDPCEKHYAGTKFTYVCQTWGASFWTEVWCDGPPRPDQGCTCSLPGAGMASNIALGASLGGLAALAFLRRRRGGRR